MQMVLPIPRSVSGINACAIEHCELKYKAAGYCWKHYRAYAKYGDPLATDKRSVKKYPTDAICEVEGCGKPRIHLTYCGGHRHRFRKYGDPLAGGAARPIGGTRCTALGCEMRAKSGGYCPRHKQRFDKYGSPYITASGGRRSGQSFVRVCRVMNCAKWAHTRGYCAMHEQRLRYRGSLEKPDRTVIQCFWPGCSETQTAQYCRKHRKHKSTQARRARKKSAPTICYTPEQLADKFRYWGNKCWMCGSEYESIDHVIPLSKGGYDCLANLRPACRSCNSRKHNKWHGVSELHRFLKP